MSGYVKTAGRRAGAFMGAVMGAVMGAPAAVLPAVAVAGDAPRFDPVAAVGGTARRAAVIAEDLAFMLDRLAALGPGSGTETPVGRRPGVDERALAAATVAADRAWAHTVSLALPLLAADTPTGPAQLPELVTTSASGLYAVTAAGVGVVAGRDPDRVLAGLAQLLRAHRGRAPDSDTEWGMPSAPVQSVQPGLTDYVRAWARRAGS